VCLTLAIKSTITFGLAEDFLHHTGFFPINQARHPAIGMEFKSLMIDSHQMQHSCLKIIGINNIINGPVTDIIRVTVCHPAFNASTRHPDGKTLAVMVSASIGIKGTLTHWQSADLPSPMNQRGIEHSKPLEICYQSSGRLVGTPANGRQTILDGCVVIPRLPAQKYLNKPYTPLHEAAGYETTGAVLTRGIII
jgi:hypothetical protein